MNQSLSLSLSLSLSRFICQTFLELVALFQGITFRIQNEKLRIFYACLLYTSDAADDMQCVDLGGRRIIKKSSYRWSGCE